MVWLLLAEEEELVREGGGGQKGSQNKEKEPKHINTETHRDTKGAERNAGTCTSEYKLDHREREREREIPVRERGNKYSGFVARNDRLQR